MSAAAIASMIPYENLGSSAPEQAPARAQKILWDGWSHDGKYPVLPVGGPFPWDIPEPSHRSWNFAIHCLDMLEDLLMAHSISEDVTYLQPALDLALEWVRRYPVVETDPEVSGFAWYDMAVGLRAQRLAYIADAAERVGLLDAVSLQHLHDSLGLHRDYLADDGKIVFHNNHGFYQVAGQLAMARRFRGRLPGMEQAFQQGQARLATIVQTQFTGEGVHREHSPDYHRMVYESLFGLVEAGLCEDADTLAMLDRIEDALAWFVYPNGILVNLGDSDSRDMLRTSREARRRWRRPHMQFVASNGRLGDPPAESLKHFPESGYAVARTGWQAAEAQRGYLALAAAFHSRTHKHADDLGLVWYDRGLEILVDSGRYGYLGRTEQGSEPWEAGFWYSDPRRMYVESTRAHNTVEIDGRDFQRRQVRPYGSGVGRAGCTPEGIHYMEAEVRHFGSVRHARTLLWLPQQWLLTIDWLHDNLGAPHVFQQWWHLAPSFQVYSEPQEFSCVSPALEHPLHLLSLAEGVTQAPLAMGDEDSLQGHYSHRERAFMPIYSPSFTCEAASTSFVTLASFDAVNIQSRSAEVAPSGRNIRAAWTAGGQHHDVKVARPAEGEMQIEYRSKSAK